MISRIGLLAGDPAGIGPELLKYVLDHLPQNADFQVIGHTESMSPGKPTDQTAKLALSALEEAANLVNQGKISAIVTGPVCKHELHRIGFTFPGQTEFFAARSMSKNFAMFLYSEKLIIALVTTHIPLSNVSNYLKSDDILRIGLLLEDFLAHCGMREAKIAVAALNPHAGESGDLGHEERIIIEPSIRLLNQLTIFKSTFSGPWSADTIFLQAIEGEFDAVIAMYHDQGLIPLKLIAFDQGVNVTWGLPFIRTSPDHGTAFHLAGKGIAKPNSFMSAVQLAIKLSSKE